MVDAVFGTTATLPALDGDVDLEIPAGAQSGQTLTVKDRGITRLRSTQRGDLDVTLQVVTPTKLDARQKELLREFADREKQASGPSLASAKPGLFSRMRGRFGR